MKHSLRRKFSSLLVLLAVLLLAGCRQPAPKPVAVKATLMASLDCEQPCWRNVVLGESEPFDIFQERVESARAFETLDWPLSRFYYIKRGEVQESYQERDGKIISVGVGGIPHFDVGLENIVNKLGKALYSQVIVHDSVEVDTTYPHLYLYYPEHGYAFRFDMEDTLGPPFTLENSCSWENYALVNILILESGDILSMIMTGNGVIMYNLAPEEARAIVEERLRPLDVTLGCDGTYDMADD
jgi:hypothetical protein